MDVAATPPLSPELERFAALDRRLLNAVRPIRILPTVGWPASLEERMIAAYRVDRFSLPDIEYFCPDLRETRAELAAIQAEAAEDHPIAEYLRRSAESWNTAAEMLEAVGTDGVTAPSIALYGRPGDAIPGSERSNLDAAHYFVELADELGADLHTEDAEGHIQAEELRADMVRELDAFFGKDRIAVVVDPELTAKAAAGATRIRLRGGASFTEYDRHQLLAHEAFVHSLTALNGREQPVLASLARTSPRVTATQEGLAVFAELMSGAIDISRLKRISLRILAIDMALNGQTSSRYFASSAAAVRTCPTASIPPSVFIAACRLPVARRSRKTTSTCPVCSPCIHSFDGRCGSAGWIICATCSPASSRCTT